MKPALFYQALADKKVSCELCPHRCQIQPGGRGICGVRENRDGSLVSLVYGKAVAAHVDPIEKKPLNHFLPGTPVQDCQNLPRKGLVPVCENHYERATGKMCVNDPASKRCEATEKLVSEASR